MGNAGCICYEPETIKRSNEYEQCNGQYYVSIKQDQACVTDRVVLGAKNQFFPHRPLTACCLLALKSHLSQFQTVKPLMNSGRYLILEEYTPKPRYLLLPSKSFSASLFDSLENCCLFSPLF